MGKKIIKKIGGDRLGSGNKMNVALHGYGYSTHDVSKIRRTSMSFGTIVPMNQYLLPSNSRLKINLDALITSNALLYQLYGSAKFQIDVFSARMALYNPKMLLNLNDQGYEISDIKFPLMELVTTGLKSGTRPEEQVNASALLRYLGIAGNGYNAANKDTDTKRKHNAMWLLMYYQIVNIIVWVRTRRSGPTGPVMSMPLTQIARMPNWTGSTNFSSTAQEILEDLYVLGWDYMTPDTANVKLEEYDLKAIDRMQMKIMANVETTDPILINNLTELPYGASFINSANGKSINASQEGLAIGTYQSDVFNNWLDNDTINALNSKNKVKVNAEGEFSIDMLNITQKLYNYDMRIGVTDGTLDEWREVTYGQASKGKSLKPVYEGGLSKEILFDQIVSTAATEESPLGDIASRGNFGSKHKGGYVQIDTDEEKLVMVLAKITPRIVYNQGNDWTTNLKTLEDLHKPALDKIGYQNLITDQMAYWETKVNADYSLTTQSAGKQPAWQWYRTSYDDALGHMANVEDYKVFGREYGAEIIGGIWKIKDLTTYIDPTKFNDVFAIKSLDAMNFDVQVGMDAKITLTMSEEVIPNL